MKQRIHIIPVGFEEDRIIEPLKFRIPEKVYLLINADEKTKKPQNDFFRELIPELIRKIKDSINIIIIDVNIYDFPALWNTFNRIISSETKAGNEVYVNLSSGNKIAAVAGMQAVQMFGNGKAHAYYVVPDNYVKKTQVSKKYQPLISTTILTASVSDIEKSLINIPKYPIEVPDDRWIETLRIINSSNGELSQLELKQKTQESVKMRAIRDNEDGIKDLKKGQEIPLDKVGKSRRFHAYFITNIITCMRDRNWIKGEPFKGKRKRFSITEEGKKALIEFDGVIF